VDAVTCTSREFPWGPPIGIDIRKAGQTGTASIIDTATAHVDPGYPTRGAGLVQAPTESHRQASLEFGRRYEVA